MKQKCKALAGTHWRMRRDCRNWDSGNGYCWCHQHLVPQVDGRSSTGEPAEGSHRDSVEGTKLAASTHHLLR
jgi:hypothetical protein